MAKTRPAGKPKKKNCASRLRAATKTNNKNVGSAGSAVFKSVPKVPVRALIDQATAHLESGDPRAAAASAFQARDALGPHEPLAGALYTLLGQIHVDLGDVDEARAFFEQAIETDGDEGAADKFLWLAQLSEDGGQDSVRWFERGAAVLRGQMAVLEKTRWGMSEDDREEVLIEKRRALAETLCAVAEVYMTDLSWEADVEQRCEALVTEAAMLAPELPSAWQTVANVRISQDRADEARDALRRSLEIWEHKDLADPTVPAYPTRVSLVRLLIEVTMEEKAIGVVDGLVAEDDTSVEAWYLGAYAFYKLGERLKAEAAKGQGDDEKWRSAWRSARKLFTHCLDLYKTEAYEDERLGEHAQELLEAIINEVGPPPAEEQEDNGDGWERGS